MFKTKKKIRVSQNQFDAAAGALYAYVMGEAPPDDFVRVENDQFFVVARVVLEGAGFEV